MLCLIRSKACKKCGGDLSLECDVYGVYIQCIQCGANWSKEDLTSLTARHTQNSVKATNVQDLTTTGHRS
jgi:hypothetical protein